MKIVWTLALAAGLGLSALLFVLPAEAQRPMAPEEFVTSYIETVKRGDFAALAALMHPDELQGLHDTFRKLFAMEQARETVLEMLQARDSEEFLGLSAEAVAARFLKASAIPEPDDEALTMELFGTIRVEEIERLPSSDPSRALVRVRTTFDTRGCDAGPGEPPATEEVMRLRKHGTEWRALFRAGMTEYLEMMVALFADEA